MDKPFSFAVDNSILALGIKVKCFLVKGLDNSSEPSEFDQVFQNETEKIKNLLSEDGIQSNQTLAGFRSLHEKIGKTGKRWISSPENLKRMLLTMPELPRINKLVSIYNLVSLQTDLALGAHDLDKISGNVTLRLTNGTEKFWPLGAKEPEKVSQSEYGYCDDANEVICRLEVRQVEKTKVLPQTQNVFFIVQGNSNTTDDYIHQAANKLAELVMKYAGGVYQEL